MHKYSIVLALICAGCATATSATEEPTQEIIVTRDDQGGVIMRENTAAEHLQTAMMLFGLNKWMEAIESYKSAVNTGNLNDAGRALVYWHVALCWTELNEEDQAMEAYSSFVIVAQDILDIRELRRYAVTEGMDFVDNFKLVHKLAWSRAYINFTWASRSNTYGRSQDNPVLAHNMQELEFFAEMIKKSCEGECDFQRALLHEDGVVVKPHTEMITIRGQEVDTFFIVVPDAGNNDSK